MNFDQYLELVEQVNTKIRVDMKLRRPSGKLYKLSKAKRDMLERLWSEGEPNFPRNWVRGPELGRVAQESGSSEQSDFGRRLRQLKSEEGCDIEIITEGDRRSRYRLRSINLAPIPRAAFSAKQREQLFSSQGRKCQICGKDVAPDAGGGRGAQADHKVPVVRRGSHERANWQTVCTGCNVAKRRACEGCLEECRSCPWAFPETFGTVISVGLTRELYQAALDRTERGSVPEVGQLLAEALRDRLNQE